MNTLFGTVRGLCHGTPSGRATDALVEACEEAYEVDPEYACEVVLPYVLPELARWSDEVVFGEDPRKDSGEPFQSEIWNTIGVTRDTLEWLIQDSFLHGLLRLEPEAFDYMHRLLARVAHAYQNDDPPMQRLDLDGDSFCDRRWPLFEVRRFRGGTVCPQYHRNSSHPLRLVASMHMVRDDEEGVFEQRLEFISACRESGRWLRVLDAFEDENQGVLQPHDGLWPGEIAFLERRLGYTFNPLVGEYLRLFGRLNRLPMTYDYSINPYAWVHCSGPDPIAPLLIENQGSFWLVIRLDEERENPRVFETDEDRALALQSGRPEALADVRLPTDHPIAFDCGSFSEVMSGGYISMWGHAGGLGQNNDDDIPF